MIYYVGGGGGIKECKLRKTLRGGKDTRKSKKRKERRKTECNIR
jgi:hypothetical protein